MIKKYEIFIKTNNYKHTNNFVAIPHPTQHPSHLLDSGNGSLFLTLFRTITDNGLTFDI